MSPTLSQVAGNVLLHLPAFLLCRLPDPLFRLWLRVYRERLRHHAALIGAEALR